MSKKQTGIPEQISDAIENMSLSIRRLEDINRAPGWHSHYHSHSFFEICYVVKWEGTISVKGATYKVKAGDIFFHKPGEFHKDKTFLKDPYELLVIGLDVVNDRPQLILFEEASKLFSELDLKHKRSIQQILESLLRETRQRKIGHMALAKAFLMEMFVAIVRTVSGQTKEIDSMPRVITTHSRELSRRAIEYLTANCREKLTLGKIARRFYLSPYHFSRIFKQETSLSPMKYLTRVRIQKAAELLLTTDDAIKKIAYEVGFNDPYYFSKVFKKVYKLTPTQSFTRRENRPDGFPQVSTGFVQGYLDGWCGTPDQGVVWGQEDWKPGNSEKSWELLDVVFPNYSGFEPPIRGWFGGTPYGQVDLVPEEAKLEVLKTYKLLIFLGWNTMRAETYKRLLAYVNSSGCLFMSLAHTFTNKKYFEPGGEVLFNKGDFSELFGVRVKAITPEPSSAVTRMKHPLEAISVTRGTRYNFQEGKQYFVRRSSREIRAGIKDAQVIAKGNTGQPVLTRKSFQGGGEAFLLLAPDYPVIYKDFVKDILPRIIAYHRIDVRLKGSSDINFAVYREGQEEKIYLLNTELEKPAGCSIDIKGIEIPLSFKPGEFKVINHRRGDILFKNN